MRNSRVCKIITAHRLKLMAAVSPYGENFDTISYLKIYDFRTSPAAGRMKHTLKFYHEVFLNIPSGVKVLDYGTGPVLLSTISAATKASEIVLADYVGTNRTALCQWLNAEPESFDWSPHFSYVVKTLEGNGDLLVSEREEQVRKLVKAVVPCDITKDPPIDQSYNQTYDVVISSLVMEAVSSSLDEYQLNISRLGKFVKPGGTILYYGVENRAGYYLLPNNQKFPNVFATAEHAVKAFERAGFVDISLETYQPSHDPHRVFRCISAICKKE